ncbi:hypothetical protein FB567DRAFT_279067 [Paraphoma chrysanthemicola]|uniref:DUF6536 domain-containing protein n=1 Tax=Paraphoma chrysanthemicola TaxID=798071 RepID=A0A8K0W1I5_9PLEO|nr:hypothetical protein FB567DRAFT_279067 [Paraphoma chrysanthemicola]
MASGTIQLGEELEFSTFDMISLMQLPTDAPEQVHTRASSSDAIYVSEQLENGSSQSTTKARKRPVARLATLVQFARKYIEQRVRRSRFHGWRMGVLCGCLMSAFVLVCNLAALIVGASRGYDKDGIADLFVGEESTISRWNTVFHVLINALSTVLLSGSNYTMQVLSSPTRDDIDNAHSKKRWMELGVLSPRNMRTIPRKRTWLCMLLSLSSTPLHLFYNAAVFKVVASNDWNLNVVDIRSDEYIAISATMDPKSPTKPYLEMGNTEFIHFYDQKYVSRGDLYVIIDRISFPTSKQYTNDLSPEDLRTELNNRADYVRIDSPEWISFHIAQDKDLDISAHVKTAFSRETSQQSRLQISLYFMVIVVAFNLFKLAVMTLVLVTDRSTYLVTFGDAVASFLKRPDPYTETQCMLGKEEFCVKLGLLPLQLISTIQEAVDLDHRSNGVWLPRPRQYFFSINRHGKVIFTMLLLSLVMIIICVPLYRTHSLNGSAYSSRFSQSGGWLWGSASSDFLSIGSAEATSNATLYNAWLANIPQLILSFSYLNINTICTAMAGAREWNRFATSRKHLRVTKPMGQQRSTYFLQLPYKWSIPLVSNGAILHWLLSQTFFLVRIDYFDRKGDRTTECNSACGFSALSLMVFIGVAMTLLSVIGVIGFWKMPMKMPIAGSCSLAISAACHPPAADVDPELHEVQWGVVEARDGAEHGHCSLSSGPVEEPEHGKTYA